MNDAQGGDRAKSRQAQVNDDIHCPVIRHPVLPLADPEALTPLLRRLADPTPVGVTETFPLGTLQPDGRLDLCKQGLGPVGAARLLAGAVGSAHTTHLLLGTNGLGSDGTRALADALGGAHRVHTLYLGCNAIDAAGAAPLFDRLADDRTVRALWLKRNPLGDNGVRALATMLRRNSTIDTLDLVNTGLTVESLRVLADALAARQAPVRRVYLGGNGLGPDAAPLLAGLLTGAGVTQLYLAANRLGDSGATIIARAVHRPGTELGLGGNGLTAVAVAALSRVLSMMDILDLGRPPSAAVLGAADNTVGDDGAALLAAALTGSPLRRLGLRHTGIRGRGAKHLLAAVERGTRLSELSLGPGVPSRVKRAIGALLPPAGPVRTDIASVYR